MAGEPKGGLTTGDSGESAAAPSDVRLIGGIE